MRKNENKSKTVSNHLDDLGCFRGGGVYTIRELAEGGVLVCSGDINLCDDVVRS